MADTTELRTDTRVKRKAKILLDNLLNGCCHPALMLNYSTGGMYFESDYAPLPGSEVTIGIEQTPDDSGPDIYRAQVRWRRSLPQNSPYTYGVGVKYHRPLAG